MRSNQVRRFLDSDVLGQLNNGLFFEGHVEDKAGRTSVFEHNDQEHRRISSTRIRWLVKAARYY